MQIGSESFQAPLNCIGHIYQSLGMPDEARNEYELSQSIRFSLTQRDPDNTIWQRDLSFSYNYIGKIYEIQ